jgi:UDP-glucose 4-epimerase
MLAITGSRGFIGSHLLPLLKEREIPFVVFDKNLLDFDFVLEFFKTNAVKKLVHLAGAFSGSFEQLVQKNVLTTQNIIAAGLQSGLQKIIYKSTGAVYGEPCAEVSFESDICNPNTLYGLSKKMAEDVIFHYHLTKAFNYVILRFPNVYGEGNEKGVLYNFLDAIHTKGEISIAGDGNQSRNFLYVKDACDAILKAIDYPGNDVFNISNPVKTSVNDIVEKLKQHYSFSIQYKPQDNFLKDLLLDTSKAERLLGFKASVSDIDSYIQNFKTQ